MKRFRRSGPSRRAPPLAPDPRARRLRLQARHYEAPLDVGGAGVDGCGCYGPLGGGPGQVHKPTSPSIRPMLCARSWRFRTLGKGFNPANYTFHGGTAGDDNFSDARLPRVPTCSVASVVMISIGTLDAGDIFLGGRWHTKMSPFRQTATFNGGPGVDTVSGGNPPSTDRRVPDRSETATREGPGRSCSGPSSCPMHQSAWKECSENFAFIGFSEAPRRLYSRTMVTGQ